jgi:pyruvate/2-oxoglutarate/acetoin dehydrogenase E1 component
MTGGQLELPITILSGYGGGRSNAAQHSDTPHSLLMNLGGVNVAVPATPADAKGLLKTAIRGRNPTFFMEASGQGGTSGEVPEGDYTVPFGKASIAREGRDVTVIAIGTMLRSALAAAKQLEADGISAEVIDPRTLVPFDEEAILRSVGKTGRAVIVEEARDRASAASHIAAILADKAFSSLKAPVKRVTVPNVAMPYAPNAEARVFPSEQQIAEAAVSVARAAA